ncbi:MAG: hypothetical protein J0L51_06250 [Rhizobiales bacterium]|nr:hypothetical protein [Hyphomicrobiales bacterium]
MFIILQSLARKSLENFSETAMRGLGTERVRPETAALSREIERGRIVEAADAVNRADREIASDRARSCFESALGSKEWPWLSAVVQPRRVMSPGLGAISTCEAAK